MSETNKNLFCQKLLDAGIAMQQKNLTIETWGNLSIRDPEENLIYITPSGMAYDTLEIDDVCILDLNGTQVGGKRKPSIEKMLHVRIYQERTDVNAIVHTHPLASTVFAVLHQDIPVITDEMAQAVGDGVRCAEYALPGSLDLAENCLKALGSNQACLLANHGAVCVGKDFRECFKVAAVLESSAEIYQRALTIGNVHVISKENTEWMMDFAKNRYGQK